MQNNDASSGLKYFRDSIEIKTKANEKNLTEIAKSHYFIGKSYKLLGKPKESIDNLIESLNMVRQMGDQQRAAEILNNIGLTYRDLGDGGNFLSHFYPIT